MLDKINTLQPAQALHVIFIFLEGMWLYSICITAVFYVDFTLSYVCVQSLLVWLLGKLTCSCHSHRWSGGGGLWCSHVEHWLDKWKSLWEVITGHMIPLRGRSMTGIKLEVRSPSCNDSTRCSAVIAYRRTHLYEQTLASGGYKDIWIKWKMPDAKNGKGQNLKCWLTMDLSTGRRVEVTDH